MRLRLVVIASALLVVLVACSPNSTTEIQHVQIRTRDAPSNVCLLALMTGRLVPNAEWGVAIETSPGELVQPIFPFGYTAATDGTRIALFDQNRRIVAYAGDRVEVGGGLGAGADPAWSVCGVKVVRG